MMGRTMANGEGAICTIAWGGNSRSRVAASQFPWTRREIIYELLAV